MTPSQRTLLIALASGAAVLVVLFALGVGWPLAAGLGAALAVSVWFALNYLTPSDAEGELQDCFRRIDKTAARIRASSLRVSDRATAAALQAGCDGIPRMIEMIGQRDVRVALPLAQRSLAYVTNVASALDDYVDVQHSGDPEYLRLGREELKRLADFTSQPDRDLSERQMNEYINSLTALNLNPPPELP